MPLVARVTDPDVAELIARLDPSTEDLKKIFSTRGIVLKAFTAASTATGLLYTVLQMAGLLTDIRFASFLIVMWAVVFIIVVQPTEEEKRQTAVVTKLALSSLAAQMLYRAPSIVDFFASLAKSLADGKITASEAAMLLDKLRAVARGEVSKEVKQEIADALRRAGLTVEQLAEIATGGAAAVMTATTVKKEQEKKGPVKVM